MVDGPFREDRPSAVIIIRIIKMATKQGDIPCVPESLSGWSSIRRGPRTYRASRFYLLVDTGQISLVPHFLVRMLFVFTSADSPWYLSAVFGRDGCRLNYKLNGPSGTASAGAIEMRMEKQLPLLVGIHIEIKDFLINRSLPVARGLIAAS